MTQPDDEETREHPAYALPPEAAASDAAAPDTAGPTPEPAPVEPTAAEPRTQPWQQPAPAPPPAPPQPSYPPQPGYPPPQGYAPPPPGYAPQPGYGTPPPGWVAQPQPWAGPQYSTSALVALAAMVLVVFGLLIAVAGAWSLTQGPEIARFIRDNDIAVFGSQIGRETLRAVLSPMPGILMVVGVLQLLVGAAVFAHKGWARALGVLLSIVGLNVGVFAVSTALALAPGLSVPMLVAIVLLLGYAFCLLALIAGGSHFRSRYAGR